MVLYETDDEKFGGLQRLNDVHTKWIDVQKGVSQHNRPNSFFINVPSRCAIVLVAYENAKKYDAIKLQMPEPDMTMKHFNPALESSEESEEEVEEVVTDLVSNIMNDVVEAQEEDVEEPKKEVEDMEKKSEKVVKEEAEI